MTNLVELNTLEFRPMDFPEVHMIEMPKKTSFWHNAFTEKPNPGVPIVMKGDSGYIKPNNVMYISGYYDLEYRPRSPWLNSQSTCVEDYGLTPTHWIYVAELEALLQ
jgi:hypothetical protein